MRKETLRNVLLLFICSGFWMLMMMVAMTFFGSGFAQDPALPAFAQQQFPSTTPGQNPPQQPLQPPTAPVGQIPNRPLTPQNGEVLFNNSPLPNLGQNTYSTATGEVRVPFQVDTSRMLAFSAVVDSEWQMLTVLDPVNQVIVVYHISLKDGLCYLRHVRKIAADLKLDFYNPTPPHPAALGAFGEQ